MGKYVLGVNKRTTKLAISLELFQDICSDELSQAQSYQYKI
jgi:hypothetical protein